MKLIGIIALSDPPRPESSALIQELKSLGVRTMMVTGDAPATAAIVARAVGLNGKFCPIGTIPDGVKPSDSRLRRCSSRRKIRSRKNFSKEWPHGWNVWRWRERCSCTPSGADGHCCIDCNRCRKIRSWHVLTEAGLSGIVEAVKEGRITFQRILTYTLNSVIKKIVQVLIFAVGLTDDRACCTHSHADDHYYVRAATSWRCR